MNTNLVQSIIELLDGYKVRCSELKETIEFMEQSMGTARALLEAYKSAEEKNDGPERD